MENSAACVFRPFSPNQEALFSQTSENVRFYVGRGNHRAIRECNRKSLLKGAPYFEKVFTVYGDPKGPQVVQKKAVYEDIDPTTFDILLKWIFSKELPDLTAKFHRGDKEVQYSGFQPIFLYYVAIRFELLALANHIMDCLVICHRELKIGFSAQQVISVFLNTNENSGLRKFVALCLAWEINKTLRTLSTASEIASAMQVDEICNKVAYYHSGPTRIPNFHWLGNALCEGQSERENQTRVVYSPSSRPDMILNEQVIVITLTKHNQIETITRQLRYQASGFSRRTLQNAGSGY